MSSSFVFVGFRDKTEACTLREYPYERLTAAPAVDKWEYTDFVIDDTLGRRVTPSLLRARQRLLRCRQMSNSPPRVQTSGGLLVSEAFHLQSRCAATNASAIHRPQIRVC